MFDKVSTRSEALPSFFIPFPSGIYDLSATFTAFKSDETALFLNSHGQRLSIRSIDLTLRRLGKEANVAVSAHRLRHSCLTNLVRRGHDLYKLCRAFGDTFGPIK